MTSEITEDQETSSLINKKKIREIIDHQKSLYWSSSSSSSLCSSSLSFSSEVSSANKSGRLLELMKTGNTSLRRLFDMEHTSLATHFQHYSGSPLVKTIPLWGSSETDDEIYDPWAEVNPIRKFNGVGNYGISNFASDGSFVTGELGGNDENMKTDGIRLKLTRKKSYRRLPGFIFWRFRRFKLRLKRLRIMICGKIF